MKPKENKKMSDGEVNDYAFKKLVGDLDGIEAKGMFDDENPMPSPSEGTHSTTVTGPGYSIEIKNGMDGQQTKASPVVKAAPEEDDEDSELGK